MVRGVCMIVLAVVQKDICEHGIFMKDAIDEARKRLLV